MIKIIKDRKLFGKLNIIDFILIICILAVAAFAYIFFNGSTPSLNNDNNSEYNFVIQLQRMENNATEKIKIGDKIYDNENNKYLGEIVSVDVKEYKQITNDQENNKFVFAENPKYKNVNITLKNNLKDTGNAYTTSDDFKIKAGKHIYARGSNYAGEGYIILIER